MITDADVRLAAARIAGKVRRTPVFFAGPAGSVAGVWFKCEFMQHTGSFKARGALNRVLAAQESGELDAAAGIVIASGGNAGLANAYAAAQSGPRNGFVPETAPRSRWRSWRPGSPGNPARQRIRRGQPRRDRARRRTGAILSHAYDQPEIVAGAGTVATELLDQRDGAIDTVIVAVGGGGLMAGIAAALAGMARVIAVEPKPSPR